MELIVADILDADLACKATQGIDVIVHLAASTGVNSSVEDPRNDMEANVIGTFNYLEAARINNVSNIFASSGTSIGECEPPLHEEMVWSLIRYHLMERASLLVRPIVRFTIVPLASTRLPFALEMFMD